MELALAADRVYMLDTQEGEAKAAMTLSEMNFGALPMVNGLSRLAARFYQDPANWKSCARRLAANCMRRKRSKQAWLPPRRTNWIGRMKSGKRLNRRTALSPDALTGLEANLRFGMQETMDSRIFGRLSAWQNWIFIRPNAVGESGALKIYGTGAPVKFNWERV